MLFECLRFRFDQTKLHTSYVNMHTPCISSNRRRSAVKSFMCVCVSLSLSKREIFFFHRPNCPEKKMADDDTNWIRSRERKPCIISMLFERQITGRPWEEPEGYPYVLWRTCNRYAYVPTYEEYMMEDCPHDVRRNYEIFQRSGGSLEAVLDHAEKTRLKK